MMQFMSFVFGNKIPAWDNSFIEVNMSDLYTTTPSQIVAYTVSWCGDCKRAKNFFSQNNISFMEIDVDNDPQAAEFVRQVNNGSRSVPTIIFPDGTKLVEPSNEQLKAKFN